MNIGIIGGRYLNDFGVITNILDFEVGTKRDVLFVTGTSDGIQHMLWFYSTLRDHDMQVYLTKWNQTGTLAAFERNKKIMELSDRLLFFCEEDNLATKTAVKEAILSGKSVVVYRIKENKIEGRVEL